MNVLTITLSTLVVLPIIATVCLSAIWSITMNSCATNSFNPNLWLGIYAYVLIINAMFMLIYYKFRNNTLTKIIGFITVIFWIVWCIVGMELVYSSLLNCVRQHDKISMLILISSAILPFSCAVLIITQIHKNLCSNRRYRSLEL